MKKERSSPPLIRIGISSCLLGEKVRFDGGHKRDAFLVETLGHHVEWVPVCPEVEVGMCTPRPSVRLVLIENGIHMIAKDGTDFTDDMQAYTIRRAAELVSENLSGYILKRSSPSCGMERVRIYDQEGFPRDKGAGLFATGLMEAFPHLPVEEEGRLHDHRLRENFVSRVFAHYRWQQLIKTGLTRARLIQFHQAHKYLLMAHNQDATRRLGRIAANPDAYETIEQMGEVYFGDFVTIMKRTPSRRNHTNALHHMAGYVSDQLDKDDRKELADMIHQYRQEQLPLIVPITMIRHYVRKFDTTYLKDQVYLHAHPEELMLLNQL